MRNTLLVFLLLSLSPFLYGSSEPIVWSSVTTMPARILIEGKKHMVLIVDLTGSTSETFRGVYRYTQIGPNQERIIHLRPLEGGSLRGFVVSTGQAAAIADHYNEAVLPIQLLGESGMMDTHEYLDREIQRIGAASAYQNLAAEGVRQAQQLFGVLLVLWLARVQAQGMGTQGNSSK